MEPYQESKLESVATELLTVLAEKNSPPGSTAVPQPNEGMVSPPQETLAQKRRHQRLALIEEFGGNEADLKQVALEAMRRGMYSRTTNRGDVELCLLRTWKLRRRGYSR